MTSASDKRGLMNKLHASWKEYCPLRDRDESREERLRFLARLVGRVVASANEFTDVELAAACGAIASKLRAGAKPEFATSAQVWKIHQIERFMGWHTEPRRLAGFLREKYSVERPEQLSARNAWRAIESLMWTCARIRACTAAGSPRATRAAVNKAHDEVKQDLRSWRPLERAAEEEELGIPF